MSRPEFITKEDVKKWADNIDNDPKMKQFGGSLKNEGFREMCYAGLWLAETLDGLGAQREFIQRMQFTAGRMCLGRDPWDVSQFILKAYKNGEFDESSEPEDASPDPE